MFLAEGRAAREVYWAWERVNGTNCGSTDWILTRIQHYMGCSDLCPWFCRCRSKEHSRADRLLTWGKGNQISLLRVVSHLGPTLCWIQTVQATCQMQSNVNVTNAENLLVCPSSCHLLQGRILSKSGRNFATFLPQVLEPECLNTLVLPEPLTPAKEDYKRNKMSGGI